MDRIYRKMNYYLSLGLLAPGDRPLDIIYDEVRVPCVEVRTEGDFPQVYGMELRGQVFSWIDQIVVGIGFDGLAVIAVVGNVPNRDDPTQMIPLQTMKKLRIEQVSRRAVRDVVLGMITHELDECLYVGEDRIFDPHEIREFTVKVEA